MKKLFHFISTSISTLTSTFSLTLIFLFLFSCTSNEIGNTDDVNPNAVYFDYEIWAEEGRDNVTVKLQYRMGGPNGTTLLLNEPSKVELDGEEIMPDSAKFSGAYYEIHKPLHSFAGKHSIVFTDLNNNKYIEEFEFIPFEISPGLLPVLKREDLVFHLKGLEPEEIIRVILTDTSFTSRDINDMDTVRDGKLIIAANRLSALKDGPIDLQFNREFEKPIKNGTKEGGLLSITYRLKREFELSSQAP